MAKIKNEDLEGGALDAEEENSALMDKRRRLFLKVNGDADEMAAGSAEGNSAADTTAALKWELDFIKRTRRKRTMISTLLGIVGFSMVFVPPYMLRLKDAKCKAAAMTEVLPFSFDVPEQLHHIEVETFRGIIQIQSDANLTQVDKIGVQITKKSASYEGMYGIVISATLSEQILKVSARYDELQGEPFGLSTCPQADIVIRIPFLSESSRSSGPTLNVTVDGQIGEPVFYPWLPNLVGIVGEIDLSFNPTPATVVFGATLLRNTIGPISVKVGPSRLHLLLLPCW